MQNRIIFSVIVAFILASCAKEEGCMDPSALNFNAEAEENCCCEYNETPSVSFSMEHTYNGEVIQPGEVISDGTTDLKFTLLQYYISNFTLYNNDEPVAEIDTVVFIKGFSSNDMEGPSPYQFELEFPNVEFNGVSFHWGIDSALNDSAFPLWYPSEHPLGPKSPSMYWSWDTDYLFLKTEGKWQVKDSEESSLTWHIGNNKLYTETGIIPIVRTSEDDMFSPIQLEMDLAELVRNMELFSENTYHAFIPDSVVTKFTTYFPATFRLKE